MRRKSDANRCLDVAGAEQEQGEEWCTTDCARSSALIQCRSIFIARHHEGLYLTRMRASRTKADRLEQLYELYQAEWPCERYFKIGQLICMLLPLRAGRAHHTHHTGRLLTLAKDAGIAPTTATRVPTSMYYCYQLARQLTKDDLQLFKQHKVLWVQIRLVLVALGRAGTATKRKRILAKIRYRLKTAGTAGLTDFLQDSGKS